MSVKITCGRTNVVIRYLKLRGYLHVVSKLPGGIPPIPSLSLRSGYRMTKAKVNIIIFYRAPCIIEHNILSFIKEKLSIQKHYNTSPTLQMNVGNFCIIVFVYNHIFYC